MNRGYDYSSTTDEKYSHGANPKNITPDNPTGSWIKDKVTGEEYKTTEDTDKAFGQYTPKSEYKKDTFNEMVSPQSDSVKSNNPLNDTSQKSDTFTKDVGFSNAGSTATTRSISNADNVKFAQQENKQWSHPPFPVMRGEHRLMVPITEKTYSYE